jgi:spermidine/putrescine transport system permease protein
VAVTDLSEATAPPRTEPPPTRRERTSGLWPGLAAPGIIWLLLCFIAPLYVVLAVVFGQLDPVFRTAVPVWNPLH